MNETRMRREGWEVDPRLVEMKLDRKILLEVRDVARSSAANATPFHPVNAAGTFAYQDGSWALRDRHVGEIWKLDRIYGIEAILNEADGIRIVFSNVDIACDDERLPKPRSPKGAGSERTCQGNLFGQDLPHYSPGETESVATFYLMVDEGGAAELSRPVVKGNKFSAYLERIYLSDDSDIDVDVVSFDGNDRVDDFDPQVDRK